MHASSFPIKESENNKRCWEGRNEFIRGKCSVTKFCLRCYSTRGEKERVDRFVARSLMKFDEFYFATKIFLPSLSNDINREKICCRTRDIPFFSPVRRLSNLQFQRDNGVEPLFLIRGIAHTMRRFLPPGVVVVFSLNRGQYLRLSAVFFSPVSFFPA